MVCTMLWLWLSGQKRTKNKISVMPLFFLKNLFLMLNLHYWSRLTLQNFVECILRSYTWSRFFSYTFLRGTKSFLDCRCICLTSMIRFPYFLKNIIFVQYYVGFQWFLPQFVLKCRMSILLTGLLLPPALSVFTRNLDLDNAFRSLLPFFFF